MNRKNDDNHKEYPTGTVTPAKTYKLGEEGLSIDPEEQQEPGALSYSFGKPRRIIIRARITHD